jgi:hypothetical protein
MNTTENLLQEICRKIINNIPSPTWENASLNIYALNKMLSFVSLYEEKGVFTSFDPEENGDDITLLIKKLREEMYKLAPNKGAWYTAYITILKSGQYQTNFDYDSKPEFKYEPSKDKFIDDSIAFPREENFIPNWLKEIINS